MELEEYSARWERVRRMMAAHDLEAVLAIDLSRDEILMGHQRWLTGYIPIGGPAAALLHIDGRIELISDRIGKPATDHYAAHGFPVLPVSGFSVPLLAQRIAAMAPRRLGIAEPETISFALAKAIEESGCGSIMADMSAAFERLRLVKSDPELSCIRESCAIADAVWEQVPEIFAVGRRNYEIVADIDHLVRSAGAEGGFHLLLPLPFLGRAMRSTANPDRIERDARYLLEISPRYRGYYSQLTIPVTTHARDEAALAAYGHLVAAKEAARPLMRPGADLSQIARWIEAFLADRGHRMASLSLGHFCGMALEEPRHDPARSFILEEGMTLIFHPVLGDPEIRSLMRADTYVIGVDGADRLNRYDKGMLCIA